MPAEADPIQRIRHGDDFFIRALADEADLYPVFPAQIAAVVAQQITGFLHRFADFHRVHYRWQRDGDDRRRSFRAVANQVETQFRQPRAQPRRPFGRFRKTFFPMHPFHRRVQRMEQVRRERERRAVLLRVITEIDIARQLVRRGGDFVAVENHRNARIRAQALAAGAGRQINAAQIHRHRADGADAIEAQFHATRRAHRFESVEIGQNARRGFAVRAPEPSD